MTPKTVRERQLRSELALARRLSKQYGGAWEQIRADLEALISDLEAAKRAGVSVPQAWLERQAAVEALQRQALAHIRVFAVAAERQITEATRQAARQGVIDAEALVKSTLPLGLPVVPALPIAETVQIAQALRPGAPLTMLFDRLAVDAGVAAREALAIGVATGRGPREIARGLRDALNVPLWRALTISRTETIAAYRRAAITRYRERKTLIAGWTWVAKLDATTCAVCVAMHGSEHDVDEPFATHPNCRCVPVPKSRSWDELGFPGIKETSFTTESGEAWFAKQPAEVQRKILGPGKFALYQAGDLRLGDLVTETVSPVWGRGLRETPLRLLAA